VFESYLDLDRWLDDGGSGPEPDPQESEPPMASMKKPMMSPGGKHSDEHVAAMTTKAAAAMRAGEGDSNLPHGRHELSVAQANADMMREEQTPMARG
jgi:hypothetical protein